MIYYYADSDGNIVGASPQTVNDKRMALPDTTEIFSEAVIEKPNQYYYNGSEIVERTALDVVYAKDHIAPSEELEFEVDEGVAVTIIGPGYSATGVTDEEGFSFSSERPGMYKFILTKATMQIVKIKIWVDEYEV